MTDERTFESMASRDQFLRLFLASERDVSRYVATLVPNAEDAREVVQQTACVLWEKFAQFDSSRPFTPWACGFALNVAKKWLERQRRWRVILDVHLADELVARRQELLPDFDRRLRHLDECLGKLPSSQRAIVDAYYMQHLDIERVAEASQRTVAATYKALQRIRRLLQDCIERAEVAEA